MTRVGHIAAVARRELASYFHAPIAYAVGVLFLAVQGFSFWAVVQALSDPRQPAPLGAVMHTYIGGTLLFWAMCFAIVATAAMRALAEDRRHGTWEALLTTPVSEGEAIAGKWLGALGYYLALWLPTVAYPLVLVVFAPPGAGPELAPIVTAYLGVALSGAALLALGMAAAAASANPIVAAVAAFVAPLALLLVGQLPALVALPAPLARALAFVDLRGNLEAFARGVVDAGAVALFAAIAAAGLAFATALAGVGRRRGREVGARATAAVLIALIGGLVCALIAPRAPRWDVTAAGVNTLHPRTREVLAAVAEPIDALVVHAGEPGFEVVYGEVERILARMRDAQALLQVDRIDPALEPQRVQALADAAALSPDVLRGGGAVVFRQGDRQRVVELLDMAEFARDAIGGGAVARLRAEESFAQAIRGVSDAARPRLCVSEGHGELSAEAESADRSAFALFSRLAQEGARIEPLAGLDAGVPSRCRALAILGPRRALDAAEARAVAAFVAGGGGVLLALDARAASDRPGLAPHGLELVLAEYGVRTPDAIVVDPAAEIGVPLTWATHAGYADHAIVAGFTDRRVTVWPAPRAVLADATPARPSTSSPLVFASSQGWAETDVTAVFGGARPAAGPSDLTGAVPVAVAIDDAGGGRMVVLGSARALASDFAARGLGDDLALASRAIAWLTGRTVQLALGERTPERVRLVMTHSERRLVAVLCVGVIPLGGALLGAVVWWSRRRRG